MRQRPDRAAVLVTLVLATLVLPGCGGGPATPDPATATGLLVPDLPDEIARSVIGPDRQDVVSGEAAPGEFLEARVACVDPGGGTARFDVLDARPDRDGASVLSGELVCDGGEVAASTIARFQGPLQITFTLVPETAVDGYAILTAGQAPEA